VPGAIWVLVFAVALVGANSRAVGQLGFLESWLVLIKLVAVAVFAVVGVVALAGWTGGGAIGLRHVTSHGGFMPFGASGVWLGCCFTIYSFIGVEIVGVTSGEAADPRTIPAAMRRMVVGLSIIYVVTISLLVALTPWNELGIGESPFVSVLRRIGVPGAAGVMNFVVLTAALSSANANLYVIVRTAFSLARAGFIPRSFGTVTDTGAPIPALLVSSVGLGLGVVAQALSPASAYAWFFSVALFGGLFVWLMIFVTHIAFRRPSIPAASCVGAVLLAAILVSTWWVPALKSTLVAGVFWLAALAAGYRVSVRRRRLSAAAPS
jgi:L-asparagine transporter-like permease